jgi:hypothetical protein
VHACRLLCWIPLLHTRIYCTVFLAASRHAMRFTGHNNRVLKPGPEVVSVARERKKQRKTCATCSRQIVPCAGGYADRICMAVRDGAALHAAPRFTVMHALPTTLRYTAYLSVHSLLVRMAQTTRPTHARHKTNGPIQRTAVMVECLRTVSLATWSEAPLKLAPTARVS